MFCDASVDVYVFSQSVLLCSFSGRATSSDSYKTIKKSTKTIISTYTKLLKTKTIENNLKSVESLKTIQNLKKNNCKSLNKTLTAFESY